MTEENKFIPEVELDISKFPSRGICYPTGAKLKYRTYTFGEIRKVSSSNSGTLESIKLTLSGITADFNTNDLTLMDCLYVGILRKLSTLNTIKFEVPYICTKCKESSKGYFTQDDIEFRDLSDDITGLPLVCNVNKKDLHFSPMTVGDYLKLLSGTYDSVYKEGKVDRVAAQAITVKNMEFKEAYEFLYGLTNPEDVEVLTEIDKLLLHDIKPLKASCTNQIEGKTCMGENSIKLEGREALISPFRKSEKSVRNRIRFGITPKSESVPD